MVIKLHKKEYPETWELLIFEYVKVQEDILSIISKKVSVEFAVRENVISEGYVNYYPVDKAHFEPSEVEYEFTINEEDGVSIEDEDIWDSYNLTNEEEKLILKFIEENYDYGL